MSRALGTELRHPRHVLVVATQCADEEELPELAETAEGLYSALTDPSLGACEPSPVSQASILRAGHADGHTVERAVKEAITRAGEAHAVLVLAFLGHGQSPNGSNALYFMAADTESDDKTSSVNVNDLLERAIDRRGIPGVIVLLDTCSAGSGLPTTASLIGGYAQGRTRVSVLAASQSQQAAYNLDFSRDITQCIRDGFDDAGEFVPLRRYRLALMDQLEQQDVAALDYDGSLTAAEEGLWLALNARHRQPQSFAQLSEVGNADLRAALNTWPVAYAPLPLDGSVDLEDLREQAQRSTSLSATRVAEVAHALIQACKAETFVCGWAKNTLSTFTISVAMMELNKRRRIRANPLRPPINLQGGELLRYFLQHEALRGMSMDGRLNCDLALARCIVALAEACGMDLADASLDDWALEDGISLALNDARAEVQTARQNQQASAVISLHAGRLDWPESISAWVRSGTTFSAPKHFPCQPTQAGTEQTLPDVVHWAEDQLPAGVRLNHIDVVVPAALFPFWRPEEIKVGLYLLGTDRSVTLRWSDRLLEPRHLRGLNDLARRQLQVCNAEALNDITPIDWLAMQQVEDVKQLADALARGRYPRAIGIGQRDHDFPSLLQTLLPYTPVLLWPAEKEKQLGEPQPELVRNWERLPTEFTHAYRWRWLNEHRAIEAEHDGHNPSWAELSRLRAAWHDEPWLDFCSWFQTSAAPSVRSV
ncbi:hypothetical protein ACFXC8_11865 [Streptomyces sp. NPDC059441]|uniref:vWA-MoxR associated conflict system protein n=1 Tax=Streptomyces sp. NPDC059441 TaxID=3346829 RepID=UPI0036D0A481